MFRPSAAFLSEPEDAKRPVSEGYSPLELSSFNNNQAMASFLEEGDASKPDAETTNVEGAADDKTEVTVNSAATDGSKENGGVRESAASNTEKKPELVEIDLEGQD
ncbi:hypothetical protein ElyMa_001591700 [Elysia marginata]|uniref:CTNNB1 binding N-teminal domain-containing protein n=1 Tax=Elysia marginata TaxID=1093978 RepID=A0AAV4JG10_9GAST|nr:hypothetical protein ElyMa_001591700 [Elysia marginata]